MHFLLTTYSTFYCQIFLFLYFCDVDCKTAEKIPPPYSCGSTSNVRKITSDHPTQGLLTSAGYPRPYPPNQRCFFELSVPAESGLVIHLMFLDLDLEDVFSKSGQCLRDYVLFTITESIMAPPSFYYDSNLRFRKDCGGQITSPGFPYTYPRNVTCNWLIRVRPNKRIYVRLLHLELSLTMAECERASVVIIDGYRHEVAESSARKFSNKGSPEIKYCGGHLYYNEEGMKSYLSISNRVLIRFVTKDNPSSDQVELYEQEGTPIGFRLLWTEIDSLVVNPNSNDKPEDCPGFLCQGGEFCVDDGHNICAERTRLCINKTLQCDGISNCAENDNSDEFYCHSQSLHSIAGVASAMCLLILLLALLLFTYRTHSRYKRKQKHLQIESTRRENSEKMCTAARGATAVSTTKTALKQKSEDQPHASILSVKQVKQETVSVSSNTSSSLFQPNTTSICKSEASPQLSSYGRSDVGNGLSNSCVNQDSQPAVWRMAPQQHILRRLQTDRCCVGAHTEVQKELPCNNRDVFAQSISIIQKALV